jgi:hypothetical protein
MTNPSELRIIFTSYLLITPSKLYSKGIYLMD